MKNYKEIFVNGEDKDFYKECEYFINSLNDNYKTFQENLKANEKEWKGLIKNKEKYFIEPECIKYKSPVTIFEGNWGIGKTKFFERLIINCINNEINDKTEFKKLA